MMAAEKTDSGWSLRVLLEGFADLRNVPDSLVSDLQTDHRKIERGGLFMACSGRNRHGINFARQAIDSGAVAIVFDPADGGEEQAAALDAVVPLISVERLGQKVGQIASRFYGDPSAALQVIGITGTNGKTSCSHYLAQALSEEKRCAVIGTLGWGFIKNLQETTHTTPDPVTLNRMLGQIRNQGGELVMMEASSHGLDQGRISGIHFRGAIYTNFSRDHLDYHDSLEAYIAAKLLLLQSSGLSFVVVNLDDEAMQVVINAAPKTVSLWGFTQKQEKAVQGQCDAVVVAKACEMVREGLNFKVEFKGDSANLSVPVIGSFNLENLLAVLTTMLAMGMPLRRAASALGRINPVPGRMERISVAGKPLVVVDYAHTPDALEKALASLKPHCAGKLKVVFGCGGDRDRGKRSLMGKIAAAYCDEVYLTDDNPREEDPVSIITDICGGGLDGAVVIHDRRRAIASAIENSSPKDVVLVAGKGHETAQQIRDRSLPFNDREVIESFLLRGNDA